jgi:O-antigen biosynthesis protein
MLEWTGERFVPWAKEPAVAYEHLHRYIWVSRLAKDKRVLDLASGEGYGTDLLARNAASACGIDIDDAAIQHASAKYTRPNLQFLRGSITHVPISERNALDLIVCFEAIEHIQEHEELMREVKRLLKPDGLFIVSTPNKQVYRENEPANPFHVRELAFAEFDALLSRYFKAVRYFGQGVHPSSIVWPMEGGNPLSIQESAIEYGNDHFQPLALNKRVPMYFIAIASDCGDLPGQGSVLSDHSDELFNVTKRESQTLRKEAQQRGEALEWVKSRVEELEKTVAARDEAVAWQATQLRKMKSEVELRNKELAAILESRDWKLMLKLRALKNKLARLVGKT